MVTVDGNIITGMGPGAALPFVLALLECFQGRETANELRARWWLDR
jgi:4-methyl-5(b-hydroxyethyl)-thiazole monophosphate biosynthesis